MPIIFSEEFFRLIYDILEKYVGAAPWHRDEFVDYFANKRGTSFYFCGTLGTGGCFNNQGGRIYISCNEEDETDEVYSTIENINEMLEEMLVDYLSNFGKRK